MRFEYNDDFKNYEKDIEKSESKMERGLYDDVDRTNTSIVSFSYYEDKLIEFTKFVIMLYSMNLSDFLAKNPSYENQSIFKIGNDNLVTGEKIRKMASDSSHNLKRDLQACLNGVDKAKQEMYVIAFCASLFEKFNIDSDIIYDALLFLIKKNNGENVETDKRYDLQPDNPLFKNELFVFFPPLAYRIVEKDAHFDILDFELFYLMANVISSKESSSKIEYDTITQENNMKR